MAWLTFALAPFAVEHERPAGLLQRWLSEERN
jgi:hypothetical protein